MDGTAGAQEAVIPESHCPFHPCACQQLLSELQTHCLVALPTRNAQMLRGIPLIDQQHLPRLLPHRNGIPVVTEAEWSGAALDEGVCIFLRLHFFNKVNKL